MKKHLIILALIFSCKLFAVDKEYIPESTVFVLSSKIDNISLKAGTTTENLLNELVFNKLASNFSRLRGDGRVSYTFQHDIVNLLNFQTDSKVIMLDSLDAAIIADVKDLENLDLLMIRIALEERVDIVSGNGLTFRYLELDDNFAFAWNQNIFVALTSLSDSMAGFPMVEQDKNNSKTRLDVAKLIFSKTNYRQDKTLLDIAKKTNDAYMWLNTYYFYKLSMTLSSMIYGNILPEDVSSWYEGSSTVITIDFLNGKISTIANSYYPNMPIDYTKIKKNLDTKVLKYADDNTTFAFASLAFESVEVGKLLDLVMGMMKDSYMAAELDNIKNMLELVGINNFKELMELFGGDVFISGFVDDENQMNYLATVSLRNEKRVLELLQAVLESEYQEANGGYYIASSSGEINIYVKGGLLHVGTKKAIEDVVNDVAVEPLSKYKLSIINNKTLAVYVDLVYVLQSPYYGTSFDMLENLYFTSEYISKTESKLMLEINLTEKEENALSVIYRYFNEIR